MWRRGGNRSGAAPDPIQGGTSDAFGSAETSKTEPTATRFPTPAATPFPNRVVVEKEQEGRKIRFEVHSLDRTPELRFRTCSYEENSGNRDCIEQGQWRITAKEEHELVVVQVTLWGKGRVDMRTRDRATRGRAAELRDSANVVYPSLQVWEVAWQDFGGSSNALVEVDAYRCQDGVRIEVEEETHIVWKNESRYEQYVHFKDGVAPIVPEAGKWVPEAWWIPTGGSRNYVYQQPGDHKYRLHCTKGTWSEWSPMQVRVVAAAGLGTPPVNYGVLHRRSFLGNHNVRYLQDNVGFPGILVFEVTKGADLKEIRWRAGEQIQVDLQPSS